MELRTRAPKPGVRSSALTPARSSITIMMRMSDGVVDRSKPLAHFHIVEALALAKGLLGFRESRIGRGVASLEAAQADDVCVRGR